jgi:hypothetical protein
MKYYRGCLCRTFILNRERAVDYLNMLERLYIFDGFAGWEPEVRLHALNSTRRDLTALQPCSTVMHRLSHANALGARRAPLQRAPI